MVRLIPLCICSILIPLCASSQTVIRESVGAMVTTFSSDRFDFQSSTGQAYNAGVTNSSVHRPGFIQPQTSLITFTELISINLYPNPTSSVLHFTFDKEITDVDVVVTDIMGNEIQRHNYKTLMSGHTDCSAWAEGMYFIRIVQDEMVLGVGKIIKVN